MSKEGTKDRLHMNQQERNPQKSEDFGLKLIDFVLKPIDFGLKKIDFGAESIDCI